MKYRDVVIHTNVSTFGKYAEVRQSPPVQERVQLSDEIWIGPLETVVAKAVMDTCEPQVFGVPAPVRQFGQLYAFVRELPGLVDIYQWDEDHELTAVVALSRLIHPTFVGFTHAARMGYEPDGVKEIFPAEIIGISKEAFLLPSHTRDWLTDVDAYALRDLIPIWKRGLSRRLSNALWHHEYAARTYYLDERWTLVCTAWKPYFIRTAAAVLHSS